VDTEAELNEGRLTESRNSLDEKETEESLHRRFRMLRAHFKREGKPKEEGLRCLGS
jgi:hypothetical protein